MTNFGRSHVGYAMPKQAGVCNPAAYVFVNTTLPTKPQKFLAQIGKSEHMNVLTIPKSKFHAKTQRKLLFFAPLRALRETAFSSNDGITRISRNISTRTDLRITASAGTIKAVQPRI